MEPNIEDIYRERIEIRQRDARYARIVQSILHASSQYRSSLRQDALYFLANNIADMVVGPMRVAAERGLHGMSEKELFFYIESDLSLIIESALSAATQRDRQQVSATSVIIGLGHVVDDLKINNTKMWGR
jgi:hypothetical protein